MKRLRTGGDVIAVEPPGEFPSDKIPVTAPGLPFFIINHAGLYKNIIRWILWLFICEPRFSSTKARKVISQLGFSNAEVFDAIRLL